MNLGIKELFKYSLELFMFFSLGEKYTFLNLFWKFWLEELLYSFNELELSIESLSDIFWTIKFWFDLFGILRELNWLLKLSIFSSSFEFILLFLLFCVSIT